MCGLNYYWFGRMVQTVRARFRKGDEKEEAKKKKKKKDR